MALYAFDGTGDRWDRKTLVTPTATVKNGIFPGRRYLTNVVFFHKEYQDSGMTAEYFSGVGSSGLVVDTIFGGAFGVGTQVIARRAFKKLQKNFKNGDYIIDIVGYSRGAASARIFAHRIHDKFKKIKDENGNELTNAPKIRFIGLFDTVVSLGNPLDNNETSFLYQFDPKLPENVENAYHAMALDLNRIAFGLDRIALGNGVKFEEVWFRGGHGDIGGNAAYKPGFGQDLPTSESEKLGPPNRLRSNLALRYMFNKARAAKIDLSSIDFDQYPIDKKSPVIISNNSLDRKAGSAPDPSREPSQENDQFHYSFFKDDGSVIPASEFAESGYEDEDRNEFAKRLVRLPGQKTELQIAND